ncbi:MAG: blue (type 1) copper domain protein [Marmoricola sp.]|nr:blue (type 1) copper domain protein [Marmoricola sp.]
MRLRSPRAVVAYVVLSLLALLAALAGVLLVNAAGPADAATTTVGVANYAFTPSSVQVAMGGTVAWEFHGDHTTTSNEGFWDSGERTSGSFVHAFPDAGNFGYHCMMHPFMTGMVRVPLRAAGRPLTGYRLTWSVRSSTPASLRYDVQYKVSGATRWTSFRSATVQRSARFNPARSATYLVRARTRRVGGGTSGWTAALHVVIR